MRVLILAPNQSRNDPLWQSLSAALEQRLGAEICLSCNKYEGPDTDLVLPFDEMLVHWYNIRASIPGRYRTIGCSFRFLDLYEFMKSFKSMAESNLGALFSNCKSFIAQFGQGCPSTFTYRPIAEVSFVKQAQEYAFISVVDKVCDQDFGLAEYFHKRYGNKYCIFAQEGSLSDFPNDLGKAVVPIAEVPEQELYMYGRCYIPTPRITDIRGGVIPIDYFKAIQYGCVPLLPKHPLTTELALQTTGLEQYESMNAINTAADKVAEGYRPAAPVLTIPSVKAFAAQIATTYKRLEATNAAG